MESKNRFPFAELQLGKVVYIYVYIYALTEHVAPAMASAALKLVGAVLWIMSQLYLLLQITCSGFTSERACRS